jgi:hypothetical protein
MGLTANFNSTIETNFETPLESVSRRVSAYLDCQSILRHFELVKLNKSWVIDNISRIAKLVCYSKLSGFQRYEDIGQGGIYTLVNRSE